jgi:hypothetical protein
MDAKPTSLQFMLKKQKINVLFKLFSYSFSGKRISGLIKVNRVGCYAVIIL